MSQERTPEQPYSSAIVRAVGIGDGRFDCKVGDIWHRACTFGEVKALAQGARIEWED